MSVELTVVAEGLITDLIVAVAVATAAYMKAAGELHTATRRDAQALNDLSIARKELGLAVAASVKAVQHTDVKA